jgi:hypothetical protein
VRLRFGCELVQHIVIAAQDCSLGMRHV